MMLSCHREGQCLIKQSLNQNGFSKQLFVEVNMRCSAAVVSPLSFRVWKRIKAEPSSGSHFPRDRSALLRFVRSQSGFFVIQWAYWAVRKMTGLKALGIFHVILSRGEKRMIFHEEDNLNRVPHRCPGSAISSQQHGFQNPVLLLPKKIPALAAKESEPDYYQINLTDWLC